MNLQRNDSGLEGVGAARTQSHRAVIHERCSVQKVEKSVNAFKTFVMALTFKWRLVCWIWICVGVETKCLEGLASHPLDRCVALMASYLLTPHYTTNITFFGLLHTIVLSFSCPLTPPLSCYDKCVPS
jgi:hypothetical protein